MRRTVLSLVAALAALAAGVTGPAQAITNGELDGDAHPYVGLMVAKDDAGDPLWRCSGALVSPTVFVTAGHCTDGAATAELWFRSVRLPDGYQLAEGDAFGVVHTFPDYDPGDFHVDDLGVVVLEEGYDLERYATLPEAGALDGLQPGRKTLFTAVGYGWQKASPVTAAHTRETKAQRMTARPHLVQIDTRYTGDYSIMVSASARTGGTCEGDSGGPLLLGDTDVIAGVVSFGKNVSCGGQSGVFRLDGEDELTWLSGFLEPTA